MEPVQFDGYGERFKDTLDNYLVHSICGHFGVLPSEIGFSSQGGLGQSGLQEGEAVSGEVLGANPMVVWLSKMLTNLSYVYLGMPRELEFKFMPSKREDMEAKAGMRDVEFKNGSITLNELRSESGRALIESPEADMPLIVVGPSAYYVTEDGLVPLGGAGEAQAPILEDGTVGEITDEVTDEQPEPEAGEAQKAQQEIKRFLRWLKKSPERNFNFQNVPIVYADVLNKFISVKDYDSARWYAERYLS
jgi:hypothetical protein